MLIIFQLRTLVDDEIKDLFETKLRDWHLQKEVNFRWCAHVCILFWNEFWVWDLRVLLDNRTNSTVI